jgi:2-polyprenyl-3-methyl-5-hydroxy-6-metoxy-1,4-benzoquinol methylase
MAASQNPDNDWSQDAWNSNADAWDAHIGEGNDFVRVLEWPPIERLLDIQPGERVLDIACGNGLTSRRMADLGAQVTAVDFADEMLRHARERSNGYADRIEYPPVDATDEAALLALGEGQYDAALCNMAMFDMAEIDPMLRALAKLLRPGGRFVFSVLHPAFNGPHTLLYAEEEDLPDRIRLTYGVKVRSYITPATLPGWAIRGQPKAQPIFHRPLQSLLGACFQAGFVLDGLIESAFPPDHPKKDYPLSWGANFSEIPPVLIARARIL